MATVEQLLSRALVLNSASDSARLDVELLLAFCLQKSRAYLRAWPDAEIDDTVAEHFESLLQRRLRGEPVAYLTGTRGFWSLNLQVNSSTLIPRPETELLVETALELLSDKPYAKVLDLGTGTGAIALALAFDKRDWQVSACDKVLEAVELAQSNQRRLGLHNVCVFQSDWFKGIRQQRFDMIVSNPPYIDAKDPHLMMGDVRFEPKSALVADNDGIADITHIVQHADEFLQPRGWLLLEHGFDQANAVKQLLLNKGFCNIFCKRDLAGIERISGAQLVR